jgi:uncharacterized protein (DUF1330 family)
VSSYFLAQINIKDPVEYNRYLEGFDRVFEKYNGKVLAVDENVKVLEGQWPFGRTVLIQFPSEMELLNWYNSPEYQQLAKHRQNASSANIALIQGR